MAIAVVAHTIAGASAGNPNDVTTGAIITTGASLLLVVVASSPAAVSPVVSDSKGNTWTGLTDHVDANTRVRISYAIPGSVGSGHTFTASKTSSFPSIAVLAISGTSASPFDQQNGANSASTTSIQPGIITPAQNNTIIVSGLNWNGTANLAINSGFTISDSIVGIGGQFYGSAFAYLIQSTAAAVNPIWSWTTSNVAGAVIANFKSPSITNAHAGGLIIF